MPGMPALRRAAPATTSGAALALRSQSHKHLDRRMCELDTRLVVMHKIGMDRGMWFSLMLAAFIKCLRGHSKACKCA